MSFKLMVGALFAATASAAIAQPAPPAPVAPLAPPDWTRPAPRPETRAEVVARTQALFARLDRNRDGVITQDEIAMGNGAPGAAGAPPPPPPPGGPAAMTGMFDRMDLNHDGVITRDEFNQAHARMDAMHGMAPVPPQPGGRGARMGYQLGGGRMLMMAVFNDDGRITLQEMTTAALQRFDRMDLNHDGIVTPEERAQARAQRGGRRGD